MTKREVASLAFTIAGVYALIQTAQLLGAVAFLIDAFRSAWDGINAHSVIMAIGAFVPFAALAFLAYILITRSRSLAARVFPADDTNVQSPFPQTDLPRLAFAVAGLLITAQALPWIFNTAASVVQALVIRGDTEHFSSVSYWASILAQVLRGALGLSLFFCSRQLAKWWADFQAGRFVAGVWRKLRIVGREHKVENDGSDDSKRGNVPENDSPDAEEKGNL